MDSPMDSPSAAATAWPLSFRFAPPTPWVHTLFRGPGGEEVEVHYSKTVHDSERIAQLFAGESVIGFDMEWTFPEPPHPSLQDCVGMLQLATMDKIGLIHLGLHEGGDAAALMPVGGTLRKILESPDVTKAGVGILGADFFRLWKYFGINARGAIELSHLSNLVARKHVTRTHSMENLVRDHLGLRIPKDGNIRMSCWAQDLSSDQLGYAASDAYASFLLYHCLDAKRAAMKPIVPPLPIHAENYAGIPQRQGLPPLMTLRVRDQTTEDPKGIQAWEFYKNISAASKVSSASASASASASPKRPAGPLFTNDRRGNSEKGGQQSTRATKMARSTSDSVLLEQKGPQAAEIPVANKPVLHSGLSFQMDSLNTDSP